MQQRNRIDGLCRSAVDGAEADDIPAIVHLMGVQSPIIQSQGALGKDDQVESRAVGSFGRSLVRWRFICR